ncbi:MAG TPA: SprB repeat-containing protein, partial [Bacteroidia bacterium]|nr:SprB repeat-containing protein [Bacteroidia bacterium]
MKKILIGILAFCGFNVGTLSAHIITVSNNAVNVGKYTTVAAALTAANPGDTIYIMGSPTDYGTVTITKPRITLMGAGYAITGMQNNYNTIVDYVYLSGVVNGVKIQGLDVTSSIQQTGAVVTVDSVDIEGCYVSSYVYILGPYWTIRNNNIDNINIGNNANVFIQNNFLQDVGTSNQATVTIDHNNFVTYNGNVTAYSGATSNATFTSNVFYYNNPENTTSCFFKNNLTVHSPAIDLNVYAGNTCSGNVNTTTNPGWTDATIPNSTVTQNTVWNYKWTFTGVSIAHNAGFDVTDIGVTGGSYPMPNLRGYLKIPQMTSLNVPASIPHGTNGNMNFTAQGLLANGVVSGEYFIDADPGIGNGTSIAFAGFDSVSINQSIATSALANGVHVIGVRVKDSSGHWSLYQASNFYIQPTVTIPAAPLIVAAEYFFDKDPGQGLGTPIVTGAAADSINVSITPSVSLLTAGFHKLFIRAENANGQWSLYEGRAFYIQPTVTIPAAPLIVTAEYFYDKDPGQGHGTPIITGAAADSVNINNTYGIGALPVGFHSMFIRTQNANGQWSLYEGRSFYVSPSPKAISPASPIVAAEYFFDKDPGQGFGTSIAITKADSVNINITPSVGAFTAGFHHLFIRTKDSAGSWSLYEGRNFYVQPAVVMQQPARIVGAEFFYDKDPGVGNGSAITGIAAADSINITQHLNAASLAVGPHVTCIRVKDSTGHWSLYEARAFTVKVCSVTAKASLINNVTCFGGNNGSAKVVGTKGTLPYSYSWSTLPAQSNDTATSLTAGTFTITVTDSTGCNSIDSVKITQPTKITVKT